MMQKFKILWTVQASIDLEEILDYIAGDNPKAAIKLFDKIKSRCAKLKANPEKYRVLPELREIGISNYREITLKPYRILYKLTQATVYIFAVVDSRRDMESFLFQRLIRE